jgi:hypothetical protein
LSGLFFVFFIIQLAKLFQSNAKSTTYIYRQKKLKIKNIKTGAILLKV